MALLDLDDLHAGYAGRPVLHGVTARVEAGEVVAVLGPNGAGKSTLLRVAAGVLRPTAGAVRVGGRALAAMPVREAARWIAGVPQDDTAEFAFTVRQVVALGRLPRLAAWRPEGPQDRAAVDDAMAALGLVALADRPVTELSGGERRRASLARCLAQDAAVLLLDEPTSHLDLGHETRLLGGLRTLARERGKAVLAALHDLNLAALFADRVLLLAQGRVVADGPPASVLSPQRVEALYGARVRVLEHPDRPGVPVVVPRDGVP